MPPANFSKMRNGTKQLPATGQKNSRKFLSKLLGHDNGGGSEEVIAVRVIFCTLSGNRKCRLVPISQYKRACEYGVGLAEIVLGFLVHQDAIPQHSSLTPSGEVRVIPDDSTGVQLPWHPHHKVVMADLATTPGNSSKYCTRSALKKALSQLKEKHGMELKVGFETEFCLLDPIKERIAVTDGHPADFLAPVDGSSYSTSTSINSSAKVLDDMMISLEQMGIVVEVVHGESSPGQFEIVTAASSALDAADNLILTREAVKAVAEAHGLVASFIPKYFSSQAGNGCHCHFSLTQNGIDVSTGADLESLSPSAQSFVAGILQHIGALCCFVSPSVNSYARILPSCWAGAYKVWGVSNKEAPLRVLYPCKKGAGTPHCELKSFDATANPYMGLAAMITAGMRGLESGLILPEPVNVDPSTVAGVKDLARMPTSLAEAIREFESDSAFQAAFANVVGDEIVKEYMEIRKGEDAVFNKKTFDDVVKELYMIY